MNVSHNLGRDQSLIENEFKAPGDGVQGKIASEVSRGWGGPLSNESENHFDTLDTSEKDVLITKDPTLESTPSSSPTPDAKASLTEETGTRKNTELLEFYETPTDLMSYEDRALVNPKDLAAKLLSRVDYNKEYGQAMLEFFLMKAKNRVTHDIHYMKDGTEYEKERIIPNAPPMFSEFGRTIGVSERTIKAWAKKHVEFQEAYEICQDIIQEFFVENGVTGNYASQFGIFAAKNLTKMKDVIVNENKNFDMKGILDSIEKGSYGSA